MSWQVKFITPYGHSLSVERHSEGGTYICGGSTNAEINVTFNYSKSYRRALDPNQGLSWLHGKTGRETLHRLNAAIGILGTVRDSDYWAATDGNAGATLAIFALWAQQYPWGIWEVS